MRLQAACDMPLGAANDSSASDSGANSLTDYESLGPTKILPHLYIGCMSDALSADTRSVRILPSPPPAPAPPAPVPPAPVPSAPVPQP